MSDTIEYEWRDGWLWKRVDPSLNEYWFKADTAETIVWLANAVTGLEAEVAALKAGRKPDFLAINRSFGG